MNKIFLESKYFSLALAAVIAIVVLFVTKVTEYLPTAYVAAFTLLVALCCGGNSGSGNFTLGNDITD